ncbi:hypothetical protein CLTEP_02210 [Clostridium tepidiprofundi DSM 19306]|uniref:YqbQ/XkdQ domain-containing protein n=1 Tax=Clostridium tepidiprofundi DSM 19306 TaxID=1121338 RepID=A0A151B7C0_9CLOT|nr:hypothetical protein [Clostridium tepidiprofundi]KYH35828.1 hypothetical protein CLTEP_02210 [Clostridium tepidiprofundi DSM 19306]
MYRLYVNNKNITNKVNNISYSTDIETVGTTLTFDTVETVSEGAIVSLKENSKEIIRAIVTNTSRNKDYYSVTSQDFAFYLNKNEVIIQFNKVSANKAIKQLLDKFGIKNNINSSLTTQITKIYKDETILDVINDILEQCYLEKNIKYRIEMRLDVLYIEKITNLEINPTIFFDNKSIKSLKLISDDITYNRSIEDMKNKVVVISDDEKSTRIIAKVQDNANISKFGLMQEVVTLKDKNIAQAKNIAQNTLKDLNRIQEEISFTILGDSTVKAGRVVNINTDIVKGKYLIKSASHSITDVNHDKVNVTLGVI